MNEKTDLKPITSKEEFLKAVDVAIEDFSEALLETGGFPHFILVIDAKGLIHPVNFDRMVDSAKIMTGLNDIGRLKEIVYGSIAAGIKLAKMVGFLDVSEVWTIQDVNESVSIKDLVERHKAKDLGGVPGRREAIMVAGRYREHSRLVERPIRRLGEMPVLGDLRVIEGYGASGRQGQLWAAVDEVLKGETGEDHEA